MSKKIFNIGDKVWYAKCGSQEVIKTCPVCDGEGEVTLILGNGDQVLLGCDYCGHGFRKPCGMIAEYEWIAEPELITITSFDTKMDCCGEHRDNYRYGNYYLSEEDLFATQEEAAERCAEKIRQHLEENAKSLSRGKKSKSYGWHAGYHIKEAAECERQAEYHRQMARICKEKSRVKNPANAGGGLQ